MERLVNALYQKYMNSNHIDVLEDLNNFTEEAQFEFRNRLLKEVPKLLFYEPGSLEKVTNGLLFASNTISNEIVDLDVKLTEDIKIALKYLDSEPLFTYEDLVFRSGIEERNMYDLQVEHSLTNVLEQSQNTDYSIERFHLARKNKLIDDMLEMRLTTIINHEELLPYFLFMRDHFHDYRHVRDILIRHNKSVGFTNDELLLKEKIQEMKHAIDYLDTPHQEDMKISLVEFADSLFNYQAPKKTNFSIRNIQSMFGDLDPKTNTLFGNSKVFLTEHERKELNSLNRSNAEFIKRKYNNLFYRNVLKLSRIQQFLERTVRDHMLLSDSESLTNFADGYTYATDALMNAHSSEARDYAGSALLVHEFLYPESVAHTARRYRIRSKDYLSSVISALDDVNAKHEDTIHATDVLFARRQGLAKSLREFNHERNYMPELELKEFFGSIFEHDQTYSRYLYLMEKEREDNFDTSLIYKEVEALHKTLYILKTIEPTKKYELDHMQALNVVQKLLG